MMSRRGFIRNGLAALAVAAAPKPLATRLLESAPPYEPLPQLPTMTLDEVVAIVFKHYREALIDNIFMPSPLFEYLSRSTAGG